jgi:hypothetical protein
VINVRRKFEVLVCWLVRVIPIEAYSYCAEVLCSPWRFQVYRYRQRKQFECVFGGFFVSFLIFQTINQVFFSLAYYKTIKIKVN